MRHPPKIVFAGAYSALVAMSILSAAMGSVLPSVLPKTWTAGACALLFLVFGIIMLRQGLAMDKSAGVQEELKEVQEEIELAENGGTGGLAEAGLASSGSLKRRQSGAPVIDVHRSSGLGLGSSYGSSHGPTLRAFVHGLDNHTRTQQLKLLYRALSYRLKVLFDPIFIQAFVMTFLGEWGDRSQISTIALAAAHDVRTVTLGTLMGHFLCTLAAVMGGFWLASRISVRQGGSSINCISLLTSDTGWRRIVPHFLHSHSI